MKSARERLMDLIEIAEGCPMGDCDCVSIIEDCVVTQILNELPPAPVPGSGIPFGL